MNELKKQALQKAVVGCVLGLLVGLGFSLLSKGERSFLGLEGAAATALYFLISGLYGALSMGSSVVYGIEEWSIFRATMTHFLMVIAGFAVLMWCISGSFWRYVSFWIMLAIMVVVYVLIWLIQYLAYRRRVEKINGELRRWKSARHKD